jgi:hypothetical protein
VRPRARSGVDTRRIGGFGGEPEVHLDDVRDVEEQERDSAQLKSSRASR